MSTLAPCPKCGAMLTPALVAAIANPDADESCPQDERSPAQMISSAPRGMTLMQLMLLGSMLRKQSS